jgi:hypothetical protein
VDVSLPHMKVAIEADGPSHFSRTPGPGGATPWPLGATAMKHRHLRAMGWALVSISSQVRGRAWPLAVLDGSGARVHSKQQPLPFAALPQPRRRNGTLHQAPLRSNGCLRRALLPPWSSGCWHIRVWGRERWLRHCGAALLLHLRYAWHTQRRCKRTGQKAC